PGHRRRGDSSARLRGVRSGPAGSDVGRGGRGADRVPVLDPRGHDLGHGDHHRAREPGDHQILRLSADPIRAVSAAGPALTRPCWSGPAPRRIIAVSPATARNDVDSDVAWAMPPMVAGATMPAPYEIVATPAICRPGRGPALPAAVNASGTTTATPMPSSAK